MDCVSFFLSRGVVAILFVNNRLPWPANGDVTAPRIVVPIAVIIVAEENMSRAPRRPNLEEAILGFDAAPSGRDKLDCLVRLSSLRVLRLAEATAVDMHGSGPCARSGFGGQLLRSVAVSPGARNRGSQNFDMHAPLGCWVGR